MTGSSNLGALLELLYGAVDRVRTVRAELVQRQRPRLQHEAFLRSEQGEQRPARGASMRIVAIGGRFAEEPDEAVWRIRLWTEGRLRHREERESEQFGHRFVTVRDDDLWSEWSREWGLREERTRGRSGGGLELIDPAPLLASFAIEQVGETEVAGRPALRLRVRRRGGFGHELGLPHWIEDVDLAVDAASGLILRRAGSIDGVEVDVLEVERIALDEELPDDLFRLEPPAGEDARPTWAQPVFTTLDAAVSFASFRVWKIDPVPTGWRVQAVYAAGAPELSLPESVTLLYSRPDGGEHLHVHQSAEEEWRVDDARTLERGGRTYAAVGPEEPEGREPSQLLFDCYGTRIRMSSSELGTERLLELADALVEA